MTSKKSKILSTSINKSTSSLMDDFNSSIDIDQRLIEEDIKVTSAHVHALNKIGIINQNELTRIINGLKSILKDHQNKKIKFSKKNEDIHMNVEHLLFEKIGDLALKIHTGRSRNDQVATDTRLWVKKANTHLKKQVTKLMRALLKQATKHQKTIVPGFTHLQVAQPVTLAHHLCAYLEMFHRDLRYFDFSLAGSDENVLGSAALAGSNYNLDTKILNQSLGFNKSKSNSMDGVSDRDFCLYFLHASATTAIHLGKLASELIIWSSNTAKLFNVHPEYSTGSSIMPQKRNPDSLELIRSKSNIIRSKAYEFSNIIASLPLTYFKDFQEDKKIIFDCYDELTISLEVMKRVIDQSTFNKDLGEEICNKFFATATDLADYLVIEKKIPFRNSYKIIANIVNFAQSKNCNLSELKLEEFQKFEQKIDHDIYEYIDVKKSIFRKKTPMSTNPNAVKKNIQKFQKILK